MSETEDAISEKLKILNQRLLDSTYLEDKIESLEEIYHFTENFTNLVGIHCLSSLIKSLEQFVHKNHFQIFFKIFNSLNGKEFVEIFLKNTKYIENIINLKNKKGTELFLLLCQVDCEKVCEIFRDKPVFFEKLSDEKLNLLCILLKDKILRKKLIDYHLMEKLLHFIDEKRSVKKVAQIYEILLKNSHFSQNYFFENIINTEKYKIFYKLYTLNTFYFYDILTAALDTTNMKFVDHQARFTKKEFIDRAFVLKRYDFISKYFYNRYGKDQNAFFSNFSNVNRVSENVNRVSENVNQISENVNQISENVNRVSENEDVDSHQNHSHINYLKEFVMTQYKIPLLDLIFTQISNFVHIIEEIDVKNEKALYFLTNMLYLKFHSRTSDAHPLNEAEGLIIENSIRNCITRLNTLQKFDKNHQLSLLIVMIMAEENISLEFSSFFENENIDMAVKGAAILSIKNCNMTEEYQLECLKSFQILILTEESCILHEKTIKFLDQLIRSKIDHFNDLIAKRQPISIDFSSEDVPESRDSKSELSDEKSGQNTPLQSTRDKFQSFVADLSSRFLKKQDDEEDDGLDL